MGGGALVVAASGLGEGVVGGVYGYLGRGGVVVASSVDGDVGAVGHVEVNGGGHVAAAKDLAHGCHEDLPDGLLVFELDLGLGGVYVDVDARGVYVEVEEVGDLFALRYQVGIGLHHCLVEVGVAHVAAIDEEEAVGTLLAGTLGGTYAAADLDERGVDVDGEQLLP